MKIIFAGTPNFAASALQALLANNHQIVAVLTQPDRPAGRGMQLVPSPVKHLALQHGIPVMQPLSLKTAEVQQQLASLQADVMVVAAYGLILPLSILQMPRLGCLNIHASLLPRWRGAAPIQRAILAGDAETGITIIQMDEGLDTGAMVLKKSCPISAQDTAQILHDRLAQLGAEAIIEALCKLDQGILIGVAQETTQATYAAKLIKSEAQLDWTQDATQLERAIRAYNPVPGAYSALNGTTVKIWQASLSLSGEGQGEPGTVLAVNKDGIRVACGQAAINLQVLQRPNGKSLPAAQFVQGFIIKAGDHFTTI
ncbi:MAG TPA: methionyl-tRNA formyltransferase [Gallionellaceae bacterium]|nr:methionyl-tRNA formyltransferase [Gallionellaceae bacterium]